MKTIPAAAAILALAALFAPNVRSASLETARSAAAADFLRTPALFPKLGNFIYSPAKPKAERAETAGRRMNLTVETIFDDEYEARQLPGVDLRIRRRSGFPGDLARYEAAGKLFGTDLSFGSPLVIESDVFGSRRTLTVRGAGMDLRLERLMGWGQLDVAASLGAQVKAESVAVLHGLLAYLPEAGMTSGQAAAAEPAGRRSYRFREGSRDYFYADGAGVDLQVSVRDVGFEDKEYDITGAAFGRSLGFGELVVRTDKSFLGPRGYRIRGLGVDMEVEQDDFGGRRRVEVRGRAGDSAELQAFLLAFARYIFSR